MKRSHHTGRLGGAATGAGHRSILRVELACLSCGHSCGETRIASLDRNVYSALRTALAATPSSCAPEWDAHGTPRCPRCRGKLFIERLGHLAPTSVS